MNVFIAIAAFMTLLVIAWLSYHLLRLQAGTGINSERLNADIHSDQLKSLENDLARGIISQQDFETTRDELQLRLLDDTQSYEAPQTASTHSFITARLTSVIVSLSIAVLAVGFYLHLGSPGAINPVAGNTQFTDAQIQQMIDSLIAKLKANPDNPKGWEMLARTYVVMGKFDEAEKAFLKTGKLLETDPNVMLQYADLLAINANGNLKGRPIALVNKVLAIDAKNPMALMMAAQAAYQAANYTKAIGYWETVLTVLPPQSYDAEQVRAEIDKAKAKK